MKYSMAFVKFVFTIFVLVAPVAANSITISGLFNTGVANSGSLLAVGVADPNYGVSGPANTAVAVQPNPSWITAPAGSQWIGPTSGLVTDPLGIYDYSLNFNLPTTAISSASISGLATSDNGMQILLNGVDTGFSNIGPQFFSLTPFSIGSGFISGANTLTFRVTNATGLGLNPSGLLVSNFTGTYSPNPTVQPVPIPASLFLLLAAMGILGLWRTRRQVS